MTAGTKVVLIDDPSRVGETTGRTQQRGPFTYIEVRFGPQEVKPVRAEFLQVVSGGDESTEDRIRAGRWGKADDLRRLLTFEKLKGCLHDFLYSMDAARIEFHEYQFKPVLKFINSPTERLLIADEVGLGKTIEAALIWLEMQARHDARRLLVVCPNMLAQKWRQELRDKFGVPAEVGTADNLLAALRDLRRRADGSGFAWICTYPGLRPFRSDLEESDAGSDRSRRGEFFHECEEWNSDEPFFDLAIFDEAHYMRNAASLTSKLGSAISNAARATLLVSATPVNNSNADLLTLLRLLDPDFFDSQPLFDALLAENRPAVQAANHLGAPRPRLAEARASLGELMHSSFVGKSPLLPRAIECVEKLDASDPRAVAEAIETVDQLNVLGAYVSRTRRVQVKEKRPKRTPLIQTVKFCAEEMAFYDAVTAMVRQRVTRSGSQFSAFHLTLPQQRMASCIPAVIEAIKAGDFADAEEILAESFDLDSGETAKADEPEMAEEVRKLMQFDFEKADSKFRELRKLLSRELAGEKVILFAYFKGTLRYLFRRLRAEGIECAIIHGDIPSDERLAEIDRFRPADSKVRVLLSSEVGAEGLDLQFCRVVINYDLPWNPMRVEQRIGRIDRVGQKADRLSIVHFKVLGTIEERLYERLHQKLGIFENSIGDLEAILGEQMQQLTLDLFGAKLTAREEEERIELTRLALENKLRLMQQLEQEGESLIAFSDLIAGRIEQNRELGRYVTAEELQRYISDFFARNYKGCVLEWEMPAPGCFRLELSFAAHDRLSDFIRAQRLQNSGDFRARKMVGTLIGEVNPDAAPAAHERGVFINHLSPLVRWITAENADQPGAFYRLSALTLHTAAIPKGDYVFRIERWSFTGLREKQTLAYGLGRIDSTHLLLNTEAEEAVGRVLREGATWAYPDISSEQVLPVLEDLKRRMNEASGTALKTFEAENENLQSIKLTQKRSHFARRRRADEQRLLTAQAKQRAAHQIRMFQGKLAKLAELEEAEIHKIERRAQMSEDFQEVACGIVRILPNCTS